GRSRSSSGEVRRRQGSIPDRAARLPGGRSYDKAGAAAPDPAVRTAYGHGRVEVRSAGACPERLRRHGAPPAVFTRLAGGRGGAARLVQRDVRGERNATGERNVSAKSSPRMALSCPSRTTRLPTRARSDGTATIERDSGTSTAAPAVVM